MVGYLTHPSFDADGCSTRRISLRSREIGCASWPDSDLINIAGQKVYPTELAGDPRTDIIEDVPSTGDQSLLGRSWLPSGDDPTRVASIFEAADSEDVRAHSGRVQAPDQVVVRMPRNSTGAPEKRVRPKRAQSVRRIPENLVLSSAASARLHLEDLLRYPARKVGQFALRSQQEEPRRIDFSNRMSRRRPRSTAQPLSATFRFSSRPGFTVSGFKVLIGVVSRYAETLQSTKRNHPFAASLKVKSSPSRAVSL